ncbi:MAG: lipopolysaccharide biosynthesis protein [Burkholderiales bacterium]|nr:lipopolysaccharide biosynthesis protein [Burkholderiales bacterium]
MTEPSNLPDSQPTAADDDEISLLDLLIVLAKYKKLILGLPFVVAVLAAGYSLTLANIYTGVTKIMPPQQNQSAAAALLGQLGGALGGLTGAATGIKNPNDLYVGMLQSRTVADNIIQRFDLNAHYEEEYQSRTRKRLDKLTTIISGKDGIISIEVDDKDPRRAADLANAYVDELLKLTQVLAVTEASQRRLFFEKQLAQAKISLDKAQVAARQALQQGGLAKVDDQGRAMLEATARLRAQIAVKEVQIGAMRTFAANRNPDLRFAQQELESMKHELAKIEGAGVAKSTTLDPSGQGFESLSLLRDLKYNEAIFELLSQQYGLAKIDEARDSTVVQVMDKAVEPDRKSKPKRALIVLLSALAAGLVAVIWAFAREAIAKTDADSRQAERLSRLRSYLSIGRR